ncbi:MAG: hypothetical protein K6T75_06980 [Acetobacteraceae bacterium]|nr:hypothetical protein [Acetobacteraceae bacterium]
MQQGPTHYLVDMPGLRGPASGPGLSRSEWAADFEDREWSRVFLTDKAEWPGKRDQVKAHLDASAESILERARDPAWWPELEAHGGRTLPGPLDPASFKGLRGASRGQYVETQLQADADSWALACLGAFAGVTYVWQGGAQGSQYHAFYPVPERLYYQDYRQLKPLAAQGGLRYISSRVAAAHYALRLARAVRARRAAGTAYDTRFSELLYFTLFQSGQQYKPMPGGRVGLGLLMELATAPDSQVDSVFKLWDYAFRRGSVKGSEDLALAMADFIIHPTLQTFEAYVRVLLRFTVAEGVKPEFQYSPELMEVVVNHV